MPPDPISARGVDQTARTLTGVGKRGADIKDSSYKIRTIFRTAEKERFAENGRGTWAPLKDSTKAAKERRHQDPRILRATNALYKSLTAPAARDQVDHRQRDELRFGTSVPYAWVHDEGRGQRKRVLIDLTPAEKKKIDVALEKYIAQGTTR